MTTRIGASCNEAGLVLGVRAEGRLIDRVVLATTLLRGRIVDDCESGKGLKLLLVSARIGLVRVAVIARLRSVFGYAVTAVREALRPRRWLRPARRRSWRLTCVPVNRGTRNPQLASTSSPANIAPGSPSRKRGCGPRSRRVSSASRFAARCPLVALSSLTSSRQASGSSLKWMARTTRAGRPLTRIVT
jgi:hypothetical protein